MTAVVGCWMRGKVRNYEATGFGGGKVKPEATITLWVTKDFKRRLRIMAANGGVSVSQYLRQLAWDRMEGEG